MFSYFLAMYGVITGFHGVKCWGVGKVANFGGGSESGMVANVTDFLKKGFIKKQGAKLIQDPRVMKVMQDERVMKVLMRAMQLRGQVQDSMDKRVATVAHGLNLATRADLKDEIRELKKTLRKLEQELEKTKTDKKPRE